jgi:hypothetical protein
VEKLAAENSPKGMVYMNAKCQRFAAVLAISLAGLLAAACTSTTSMNSNPGNPPGAQAGGIAIYGQDAPLASVVSFHLTLTGLTASDGVNTTNLLTQPQTVDFARLMGLRTLLDLNSAPVGTYTSVTLTLANPMISYINVPQSGAPTITTIPGMLTSSSVTVLLNPPLVITDSDLNGLRLDFDLRQSLQVDVNGQITGTVVPTFDIRQVNPDRAEAEVDDLRGGVVSTDPPNNTFVMQLANGRQLTVHLNTSNTVMDSGDDLSTFNQNTIVEVSGELNRITRNLEATEVIVLTQDRFIVGGLITDFQPPSGAATQFDLFVRDVLPALQNVQPGSISTFALTGNEKFLIYRLRLPITQLLFNDSSLVLAQRITIGGKFDTSPAIHRVVLHRQGIVGPNIPGTTMIQNGNNGTFQINEKGLVGVLQNAPLTVLTSDQTLFIGLSGLSGLTGTQPVPLRVAGLLLKNPATGGPIFVASLVETP